MSVRTLLLLMLAAGLHAQTPSGYTAYVTGSGYSGPPAIQVAPGQIATFFVGGLSQSASGLAKLAAAISMGGVNQPVPVLAAKPLDTNTLAITVQLPFNGVPDGLPPPPTGFSTSIPFSIQFAETDNPAGGLCAEGSCTAPSSIDGTFANPHIIDTCDVFYRGAVSAAGCQSAVTHQSGAFVTPAAPAKAGEIVTVWALGLGSPVGGIPAGAIGPIAMNDIILLVSYNSETGEARPLDGASSGTHYLFAGLPSPAAGLYQINFEVPPPPPGVLDCPTSTPPAAGFVLGTLAPSNTNIVLGRISVFLGGTANVFGVAGGFCVSAQ